MTELHTATPRHGVSLGRGPLSGSSAPAYLAGQTWCRLEHLLKFGKTSYCGALQGSSTD